MVKTQPFPKHRGGLLTGRGCWTPPVRLACGRAAKKIRDDDEIRCPSIRGVRLFGFGCDSRRCANPAVQRGRHAPGAPSNRAGGTSTRQGAAHAVNEAAWAAAYAKAQSPVHWLGMTSVSGPSEAWFLTRHESFAAFEKAETSTEANPALLTERDKLSAVDGELLTRTSTIIARYRPALSYQPVVALPNMRYMTVNLMRVKAGHVPEFTDEWRIAVDAHKKANMDEHWAVYEVESGMPDTTFLFLYAHKSLAEMDASGPMHAAAGYRDAVGESGRGQMNEMNQSGIELTQTMRFRLRAGMSTLPKEWAETDPYWARPAAPAVAPVAAKKQKGQ